MAPREEAQKKATDKTTVRMDEEVVEDVVDDEGMVEDVVVGCGGIESLFCFDAEMVKLGGCWCCCWAWLFAEDD